MKKILFRGKNNIVVLYAEKDVVGQYYGTSLQWFEEYRVLTVGAWRFQLILVWKKSSDGMFEEDEA